MTIWSDINCEYEYIKISDAVFIAICIYACIYMFAKLIPRAFKFLPAAAGSLFALSLKTSSTIYKMIMIDISTVFIIYCV